MLENALDEKLRDVCRHGKAIIPYLTVGDPNLGATYELLCFYASEGATMIEIGLPFSDPIADGPVIQRAMMRALETRLEMVFEMLSDFRRSFDTPLLIMGYFNTVLQYGLKLFAENLAKLGVVGAIIVDLPLEEAELVAKIFNTKGIHLIPLISPLTGSERLKMMGTVYSGFSYLISVTGVTGSRKKLPTDVKERAAVVREILGLPVLLGFGVSTGKTIEQFRKFVDGFIVGSALIEAWEADKFKVGHTVRTLWTELVGATKVNSISSSQQN
ncbi:tryptophan synthase subunit alpha [Fervidobacterium thailandense]|uniref:Tryptophan synthase alpha chain n=1 Tax=Fervidobacterium thailandense TaxID=1008305 RepID=A0A1E3G2W8_9BACT|nr:tryptophan synthase subunit alpha [Fervidobacterium thailandense]ODN30008.1 hypothetical protein A4H02_07460 [Fervidobacterium thailandense]